MSELEMINFKIINAKIFVKTFSQITFKEPEPIIEKIRSEVEKIATQIDFVSERIDFKFISESLCKMKVLSSGLYFDRDFINRRIDKVFKDIKQHVNGAIILEKVITFFKNTEEGQLILAEHEAFQGKRLSERNKKTQQHGIDHVLDVLKGDDLDKPLLKKKYLEFDDHYQSLLNENLKPEFDR